MIFLIPLFIIIGIVFGIDYYYYSDEDAKIERKAEPSAAAKQREKRAKAYFDAMLADEMMK